jgi:hypothetical protein
MKRGVLVLVASVALGNGWSAVAHAGPVEERRECSSSAEKAQRLRKDGKLRESRDKLVICARATCPALVRHDCEGWLGEVEALLPSVVVTAKDQGGKDVVDVKVFIDDKAETLRLDGKAIDVDPGVHTFRYERSGSPPVVNQVVIREGERARPLEVAFDVPGGPKAPDGGKGDTVTLTPGSARGLPVGAIVFGALGVVGVGTFAYFHLTAKSDRDHLKATCAPGCDPSAVDDINRKIIISDVALGVGLVSLGVAAYLLITRPSAPSATTTPIVRGAPGGAFGGVHIRF